MKTIDSKKTVEHLVEFLRQVFQKANFSKAIIALSGGIDSATSCALAVRALEKENVTPVILPYGQLSQQAIADALEVTKTLDIPQGNILQIDIKSIVDEILKTDPQMSLLRKGNIMARIRMTILFDQAKKQEALVVGTENKSEHLLGYFTRFGDEASDIEPIRHLYKTQIYQLAKYLELPEEVLTKKPTAGLWEDQTDEGEFGFTYEEADKILYYRFDEKLSKEEIVAKGLSKETVKKVLEFTQKNSFKHKLPFTSES